MTWFLIIEKDTGKLRSQGTVLGDKIDPAYEVVELPDQPKDSEMWDENARRFVPRPPKILGDVYDDLLVEFKRRGSPLNLGQEQLLKQALIDVVGDDRFYNAASGWQKRGVPGVTR